MNAMKKAVAMLALAVLGLVFAMTGLSEAAVSDALTITITPSLDVQVDITTGATTWNEYGTGGSSMDLGTINATLIMGDTVFTVTPATLTIQGTFSNQEVEVVGSSPDTWLFDANETPGQDEMQVYSLFTPITRSSAPTTTNFVESGPAASELILESAKRYGLTPGDDVTGACDAAGECDNNFQNNLETLLTANENLAVSEQRHVWLRADLPPTTSVGSGQQRLTVTFTALNGND